MTNKEIVEFVDSLTPAKQAFLAQYVRSEKIKAIVNKKIEKGETQTCPSCGSRHTSKHGSFDGKPRFKCMECHKYFNKATGSELAHTKKAGEFQQYIILLFSSISINKAAKKLGVTGRTVFLWRQKILATFSFMNVDIAEPEE
jgi:transposase-like protein